MYLLVDCATHRIGAYAVRDFRDRGTPLAVCYCRATRRSHRRILRSHFTISQFLVCLSRSCSKLQYCTRRHGAVSYVPARLVCWLFGRPRVDWAHFKNSGKDPVVFSVQLLRSQPLNKLGLCDCISTRFLAHDDNPVRAIDGLNFDRPLAQLCPLGWIDRYSECRAPDSC